ncbi:MAG: DUF1330 domain-containing protein [Paracoccaceae bacterium]
MPALWIARVDVTDAELYGKYIEVASKVIPAHGGVFIARGGRVEPVEGQGRERNVVARFPDIDTALGAYNDPEYQEAVTWALKSSNREVIIVETTE